MKEIWKDIKGYEGFYQVSNMGRVKGIEREVYSGHNYSVLRIEKEKIYKGYKVKNGYIYQTLLKNGKRKTFKLHRLVAETFIPNPDNKPQVNHIDGDKENNKVSNLEWVTRKENLNHAYKTGLSKICPVLQYDLEGNYLREFKSIDEATRYMGKKYHGNIMMCCQSNNKRKTAYGYIWKYKNKRNE